MTATLLNEIINTYLKSRDFNGLLFRDASDEAKEHVIRLVKSGKVQVVSEEDYPNPHIGRGPLDGQSTNSSNRYEMSTAHGRAICLYPTSEALARRRLARKFSGKPYSTAMARGRGTLEPAYLTLDVLEQYRNDPRFEFNFSDFGVRTATSEEVYLDEDEPEYDSIVMSHIGFAYDMGGYRKGDPESPIHRRVCAFHGDLAKLSDVHQQRWKTYEVPDSSSLRPHPVWWGSQMGHWPDGLGPFQRMFFELEALNDLNRLICGVPLFRTSERPAGFGWILRPSEREWDAFIHELDKLLSDNLSAKALDALGAPKVNSGGQNLGTIGRLEELLKNLKVSPDNAHEVIEPLREVRRARQKPAHAIRTNLTDKTFTHKQVALLHEVVSSLIALRTFWATHPSARAWQEPNYVREGAVYLT
ncbi:hypothetical protein [Pseudonocardia adelaidensis]|uniref:ATPase AAA n=1 Tax=Pseudonocardia adelaidensis TaxID=648754 RepID=A0ABP9NME0_9PSEU